MKALAWQQFFQTQREEHSKLVFTVTELANAAQASRRALNVELSRLLKRGLIVRYARGRYGATAGLGPEALLPPLEPSAYVTGMYALHRHNLITQVPSEITCFSSRRHNRSRKRSGPLGRFVFVCVSPRIYRRPVKGLIASPEQAMCDFLYLMARQSLVAETLVSFQNLRRLEERRLKRLLPRYPQTVAAALDRVLAGKIGNPESKIRVPNAEKC